MVRIFSFEINSLCYALVVLSIVYTCIHGALGFPVYEMPEMMVSLVVEIGFCVFVILRRNWARILMIVFGAASAPYLFFGIRHEPSLAAAIVFVANVLIHLVLVFQLIQKKYVIEFSTGPSVRWGRWVLLLVILGGVVGAVAMILLD